MTEVFDIAARWEPFGKVLHIRPATLDTIKAEPNSTPESCLSRTLAEFLRKNYDTEKHGEPSWRLIVRAVAHKAGGNNTDLALSIAHKHLISGELISQTIVMQAGSGMYILQGSEGFTCYMNSYY